MLKNKSFVITEAVEVDADVFHKWMAGNRVTSHGAELRKQAREWIQQKSATLISTTVVTARSGQRAKVESIREIIYPTEADPSEIPNETELNGPTPALPATGPSQTAFETRNVGITLEVDPVLGADEFTIDLNLAPETVSFDDFTHWPPKATDPFFTFSSPLFNEKKVTTQITLTDGSWALLGTAQTKNGSVLMRFVRADIGRLGYDYEKDNEVKKDAAKPAKKLTSRTYQVSPRFLSTLADSSYADEASPTADPFAAPSPSARKIAKNASVQELLENVGVQFAKGSGARAQFNPILNHLLVENTPEQLDQVEGFLNAARHSSEKNILLYAEWIETDINLFSDWLSENHITSAGESLREQAAKWIGEGKAEIINSASVVARSGQRAKVESVDQYTYATEFDPAEIPNDLTLENGAETPITPFNPAALETRNLGTTFEVDPVLGNDMMTIDLNLAPEIVELDEIIQWPPQQTDERFQAHLPVFYTQKATTQITTLDGIPALVATTRPLKAANPKRKQPIVLLFVRPDVSSTMDWSVVE